jgi:hypothetical protein
MQEFVFESIVFTLLSRVSQGEKLKKLLKRMNRWKNRRKEEDVVFKSRFLCSRFNTSLLKLL